MKILDLFCGAGGAAMGLYRAAHEVVGVDIEEQPNYPFTFIQEDALTFDLDGYDAYWASPPCQAYTWAAARHRNKGKIYPELISAIKERLLETKKPFIIENVAGAPIRKDLMLCGTMFKLNLIRHRYFEIEKFEVPQLQHQKHKPPIILKTRKGTIAKRSQYCTVAGNGSDGCSFKFADWQKAMGINWMIKRELTQAVPPAYAEYIGNYLFSQKG